MTSLFGRLPESCEEQNHLPCKSYNFNSETDPCASSFTLSSFSLTQTKTCDEITEVEKRAFFSAYICSTYICSHTQSTFINKWKRQPGKLIDGIVLTFINGIKSLANLSLKSRSVSCLLAQLWAKVRFLDGCVGHQTSI